MSIFRNGQELGRYTVQSLIKENLYTETYRAEDENHTPFFLKAFIVKRLPEKLLNTDTGTVFEIEYAQRLTHRNIISFVDKGTFEAEEGTCQYYLTNYFSGELLVERIQRSGKLSEEEAQPIFRDILEGLRHMHKQSPALFHNDMTPRNVMLPSAPDAPAEIIDLGHTARACSGKTPFDTSDLDLIYSANETFVGVYDEQSDIFAATAVFYTMLTGQAPWVVEFPETAKRSRRCIILKDFRKDHPLEFESMSFSPRVRTVLQRGLAINYHDRYKNIDQMLRDLLSEESEQPAAETAAETPHPSGNRGKGGKPGTAQPHEDTPDSAVFDIHKGTGNGFQDIAGMTDLKNYLTQRVIFVIKDKERAAKYRIMPPNGMLLYGPPGCGKTFVAEKFAEETGFNFALIKSSDLSSSYLHGSQEKIAALFKQAASKAPVVLCFDEFDALVPDRSTPGSQYVASEVNEFLSQLNNCSQRGIFVVATSNRPDKIDPAVLRTGRIDKQVYVPLPDRAARREMFQLHLNGRPCSDIDTDLLAELAEGYIASDIAYVVNDAAMTAAFTDQPISQEILETAVRNTHPSLRRETLRTFEDIRRRMEGIERRNIAPVGFPTTAQALAESNKK